MNAPRRNGVTRVRAGERRDGEPAAVEISFCGGCDPHIDRVTIVEAVARGYRTVRTAPGRQAPRQPALYMCGCRRACAGGHRLLIDEEDAVVVAGEHVDAVPATGWS